MARKKALVAASHHLAILADAILLMLIRSSVFSESAHQVRTNVISVSWYASSFWHSP